MPEPTTLANFERARRTGITKTTRVLEAVYLMRNTEDEANLRAQTIAGMPQWLVAALRRPGSINPELTLSQPELDHIRDWPDDKKQIAQQALISALDGGHQLRVFWRLYNGVNEDIDVQIIREPDGSNTTVITFLSPERRVRQRGPDDFHVDVGPGDQHQPSA